MIHDTVTLDDLLLKMGEDGRPLPVDVHSPYLGKNVKVRPFTYGFYRNHCAELEESATEWPDEVKLLLLKECIVDPDLSSMTVEQMRDQMDRVTVDHLIVMIVQVSVPLSKAPSGQDPMEALRALLTLVESSEESNSSSITTDTDMSETGESISSIFTRFFPWSRRRKSN